LIDSKILEKFDSLRIHKIYDSWPSIASESYNTVLPQVDYNNISHIVFAGMGGSGAIHDAFSAILSKTNVHVSIVKGYHLPKTVDSQTLVVTSSVSGNTAETLTVLDSAKKINCKLIAFSDGGKMKEYCIKNNIEHRNIPLYHSPRGSFPSFLFSMLKVLQPVIPIKKEDIVESINNLNHLHDEISSSSPASNNPAIELAEWITNIPIIYYPWGLQAAAVRFKNSLQENAKMHAMMEDVIEAGHNGVVAWEKDSRPRPICIRGHDDYVKTKERWDIMKEFFEQKQIEYKEIFSVKGGILTKLVNLIYLLDYSTIYLAVMSGIDPSPVDSINFIKSRTK
jgi:glucose/mannose-6-phosphate isomerase